MSYDSLVGRQTSSPSYESYLAGYHGMTPPMSKEQWERRRKDDAGLSPPSTTCEDTNPAITAADICTEAARLVGGPRQVSHGDKHANFQNIATLWNAYWEVKSGLVGGFTPIDVGNMMELMKIARRFTGAFNLDDYTDAVGYAACTGEIAASLPQSHS